MSEPCTTTRRDCVHKEAVHFRDLIFSDNLRTATLVLPRHRSFLAPLTLQSVHVPDGSARELANDAQPFNPRSFEFNKVLRIRLEGQCSTPSTVRISGDLPNGSLPATKGDVLIHRRCLVAQPVGSEWRTRRPYQRYIQTNQKLGENES